MDPFHTFGRAAAVKFQKFLLKKSKKNYRGEARKQVNEWLTMRIRGFVRQLDLVLRNGTRPEPARRMAVRQPPVQDDPVHETPAVVHGWEPDVRAEGVHDDRDDAWQGGQVVADVRVDVHTAGDDAQDQGRQDEGAGLDDNVVQAKEANTAHDDMRGIGSSSSCHQQAAAVSQETGG